MKAANKTIVLTGGGSGIGRELCLQLVSKGARVAIADINEQGMEETKKLAGLKADNITTNRLDIADKEAVKLFAKKMIEHYGAVDAIINNAGVIQPFVKLHELDEARIEKIMHINFYGTLYMIQSFLPHLLGRSEAHIVNVASMAAFIPFPGQTLYSASKAAVKLLTEGLYGELMDTNVKVTLVMPGAIATNITANSGVEPPKISEKNKSAMKALPASQAASIIIQGMETNKPRVLVGSDAAFLDKFYRFSPVGAVKFIVNKMKQL